MFRKLKTAALSLVLAGGVGLFASQSSVVKDEIQKARDNREAQYTLVDKNGGVSYTDARAVSCYESYRNADPNTVFIPPQGYNEPFTIVGGHRVTYTC